MELKLGTLKKPPLKKNTFQLKVEFDDGDDINIFTSDKEKLELLIKTYSNYKKNLNSNWNSYCNPEHGDIGDYFKDTATEMGIVDKFSSSYFEDMACDYWSDSHEYPESYSMFERYSLTYHDENGLEFNVSIVSL